ncbi:Metallo-dependent phosphatase [Meredithblackwellia eburnea MCA 4105]
MAGRRNNGQLSSTSLGLVGFISLACLFLYFSPPPKNAPKPILSPSHHHPAPQKHHTSPTPSEEEPLYQRRVVGIADIHGDLPPLTQLLRYLGLIDLRSRWVGGDTILVQTGDIVDRGRDTIAIYRLMDELRPQAELAGGGLVSLLGNHEIMNALGDWRYVTKEDIATFGGARQRREAMGPGWIGQTWRQNYSITARVPFTSPSSFTHLPSSLTPQDGDPQFYFGDKIHSSVPVGKDPFSHSAISFVHGGITPDYLDALGSEKPIQEMNRIGKEILQSVAHTPSTRQLPPDATPEQRLFWSEHGPMWDRTYALDDSESEVCEHARVACERLGVKHLVMGHTPHFEGPVMRCNGKVLLIDTGISRAYGGAISAVEFLYTLSPIAQEEDDVDNFGDEARRRRSPPMSTRWREKETVTAWFVGDRPNEVLVRDERVLELPVD